MWTFHRNHIILDLLTMIFIVRKQFEFTVGKLQLVHKPQFSQPALSCSKLTVETLEQIVKYIQS